MKNKILNKYNSISLYWYILIPRQNWVIVSFSLLLQPIFKWIFHIYHGWIFFEQAEVTKLCAFIFHQICRFSIVDAASNTYRDYNSISWGFPFSFRHYRFLLEMHQLQLSHIFSYPRYPRDIILIKLNASKHTASSSDELSFFSSSKIYSNHFKCNLISILHENIWNLLLVFA